MTSHATAFEIRTLPEGRVFVPFGDWTIWSVGPVDAAMEALRAERENAPLLIDVSHLGAMDTTGALEIDAALRDACAASKTGLVVIGDHPNAARLLAEVKRHRDGCAQPPLPRDGIIELLERTGKAVEDFWKETIDTCDFVGRTIVTIARLIAQPWKWRWTAVFSVAETAGLNALPIVMTLAFFIGAVIAFMGATLLAQFGASVFTVELVGIIVLREFGVLITAIMLAGRSDSAFTAQIGSMKMQQEIDAMRVLGLDPFEVLVAPRVLALLVMTPILTLAAMLSGVTGGAIVAWTTLDIGPMQFFARMQENVGIIHFWAGMAKAPVFALIIAIVGCRQGLEVKGDVQSLGARVTASVVQAIFLVIVIDAVFAMLYLELDI